MTTPLMTGKRMPLKASFVVSILRNPDMSRVIRRPPISPRGGNVYVFCIENNANREAWKNDNIHFHHDGTRGQPKTNPIVRKVFFCAMTGDGRWTRDFMKHVYTLYHNPNNFVVIHYLGDESIARDVPRHRKPRSNTKKHTTCTSTAIQVDTSELSPLSCGSDQQDEDDQVIEDGVHDDDNDDFGVQVELSEPMVEIDIEDEDSVVGQHGMFISCNYEHDFHSDGNRSEASSTAPIPSTSTPYQGIGFMESIPFPSFDMVPMSNPLGLLSEVTHLSCRPMEQSISYSPGVPAGSYSPSEASTSYAHLGSTSGRGIASATVTAPRESEPSSVIPKKRLAMRLEGQDSEISELLVPSQPSLLHIQPTGLLPKKRRLDFEEPTPGPSSAADSFCDPVDDPGDSNDTGQSSGSAPVSGVSDDQDSTLVISELTSSSSSTPRLRSSVRDGFQHSVNSLVQNVQNLQTMLGNPEMWEHNPETRDAATEPVDNPTNFEYFITSLISSGQLAQIVSKVMQLAVNWKQRPGAFNSRYNACLTLICQVQSCWAADMEAVRTRLTGRLSVGSMSECDAKNYINLVIACVVGVYRTRVPLGVFLTTLSAWPSHLEESDSRAEVEVDTDLRCVVGRTLLTSVQLSTLDKMEPVDGQVVRAYLHLLANQWTSCLSGHCLVLPSSVQRMWEAGRYSQCKLNKPARTQAQFGQVAVPMHQPGGQVRGCGQPTALQQGVRGDPAPPAGAEVASSHAVPDLASAPSENVKKCKNFLSTLLKLASTRPPETAQKARELVQDLIDGNVRPEVFVERLQETLDSSPQPYLIPFIKKTLPSLREWLRVSRMRIEGLSAPPPVVQHPPEQVPGSSPEVSQEVGPPPQQDTLSGYTWILLPYRVSDSHWALLVANMAEQSVSVVNPDQQQYPHVGREIIQHWRRYMECERGPAGEDPSGWREEERPVFNLTDPSSSAVHLLMAAEAILCGTAPVVMRTCHVRRYRQYVLSRLLSAANFDFSDSDLPELVDNDLDLGAEGDVQGEIDECSVSKKGGSSPKLTTATKTFTSTSTSTSEPGPSGVCTVMPSCTQTTASVNTTGGSRVKAHKRTYSAASEVSDQDQAIDFSRSHNSLLDHLLHDSAATLNNSDPGFFSMCHPKEHSYANRRSSTQSSSSSASQEESSQTNSTSSGNVSCTIPSYKTTGYSFQQVSTPAPRQPPRYPTRVESLYPSPRSYSRVSSTAVQEKPCDMSMQSQLALDSQPSTSSQVYQHDTDTGGEDLRVGNTFRCYDPPSYSVSESEGSTYTELSNVRPCDLQTGGLISSTLSDKGQGRRDLVHLLSPSTESNSSETINVDSLSPNSEIPVPEQLIVDTPADPSASGSVEASSSSRLSPVPSTSTAGLQTEDPGPSGRGEGEGHSQHLSQEQSNLQMLSIVAAEDAT